jgi:hypothetical protein
MHVEDQFNTLLKPIELRMENRCFPTPYRLILVLFHVMCVICVLCLTVVPLPPGENPFAFKINNNNKIIFGHVHVLL